jgi:hypothetical protein
MILWGWTEARLGYKAAARPDDEVSTSAVRDPADAGLMFSGTAFRTRMGQSPDDHQPGPPQPKARQEERDAPGNHSRALVDII